MAVVEQAVLLAAGRGRRLGVIGTGRPKCLIDVNGRTLLEYAMSAAADAGLRRVVVVLGFQIERVERCVYELGWRYGLGTEIVCDDEQVGGMNSVCLAAPLLDEDFVVTEVSVMYKHELLRDVVAIHESRSPFGTMALTAKHREATGHIWVDVDGDQAVAGYERDQVRNFVAADGRPWIYTGVGAVNRRILDHGPTHEDICQALSAGMRRGERVVARRYDGTFNHIATPFCVARARREVDPTTLGAT